MRSNTQNVYHHQQCDQRVPEVGETGTQKDKWSSTCVDLCDDSCMCCSVLCCFPCVYSQLVTNVGLSAIFSVLIWIPFGCSYLQTAYSYSVQYEFQLDLQQGEVPSDEEVETIQTRVSQMFMITMVSQVITIWLVYKLRAKFAYKYNLPNDNGENFVLACCCSPCSLCQMGRHAGFTQRPGYSPCSCGDTIAFRENPSTSGSSTNAQYAPPVITWGDGEVTGRGKRSLLWSSVWFDVVVTARTNQIRLACI